jgi:hypothetical protein
MLNVRLLIFVSVVLGATLGAPKIVSAAPSRIELQAREAFGASRYQEALDLYAKLYAEKLHPVYLRNIGRCYQNLGEPDKAISSFREYQRKAKQLSKDERAEVDGFIAEMEALKKQREAAAATPVEPVVKPSAPPPVIEQPLPPETTALTVSNTQNSDNSTQESSVFARPWFWGVVGAVVVVAVVGGLAASGAFSSAKDPVCEMGRTCGL